VFVFDFVPKQSKFLEENFLPAGKSWDLVIDDFVVLMIEILQEAIMIISIANRRWILPLTSEMAS
jgi:hypothetical protein